MPKNGSEREAIMKGVQHFTLVTLMLAVPFQTAFAGNKPFPQSTNYDGFLKPNHAAADTPSERAEAIKAYYRQWKSDYIKSATTKKRRNIKYVEGPSTGYVPYGWPRGVTIVSASEHTGYGMLLSVLMDGMAGPDSEKPVFDGLLEAFLAFKSNECNCTLMSWAIPSDFDERNRSTSATDGDLDIALALLMADRQWGSSNPNYKMLAEELIKDIVKWNLARKHHFRIHLGDWASHLEGVYDESKEKIDFNGNGTKNDKIAAGYYFSTRPSDWMIDHFHAYAKALPELQVEGPNGSQVSLDAVNSEVRGEIYRIYNDYFSTQTNADWKHGLVPDFVVPVVSNRNTSDPLKVRRAPGGFLGESSTTGMYSENSSRVPWRIISDAVVTRKSDSKDWAKRLAAFAMSKTRTGTNSFNWERLGSTHDLDGRTVSSGHGQHFASMFISSLISQSGPEAQNALNQGWEYMKNRHTGPTDPEEDGYFKDSLTLFSMLLVSHNVWWP